jgi:hypothetical protein
MRSPRLRPCPSRSDCKPKGQIYRVDVATSEFGFQMSSFVFRMSFDRFAAILFQRSAARTAVIAEIGRPTIRDGLVRSATMLLLLPGVASVSVWDPYEIRQ